MKARVLATVALLVLAVLVAGAGYGPSASIPVESATAPADTAVSWFNSTDGRVYHWYPWAQLWLEQGKVQLFTRGTNDWVGALKYGHNTDSDTTTASPSGFFDGDSLAITDITMTSDPLSGTDATLRLFETSVGVGVTEAAAVSWDAVSKELVKQAFLMGPGYLNVYVDTATADAAIVPPDMPTVEVRVRHFAR
jgi:hypothetical protein